MNFRNPTAADIGKTVEVSQDGHEWQTGTLEQWTIDKDGNWFYVVDPLSRHGSFEFCRVPYSTPDPIAELSMAADKLIELGAPEAARVLMAEIERLTKKGVCPVGLENAIVEASLEEIRDSYDWGEVFGEGNGGNCTGDVESHDGTPTDPVRRVDIAKVWASVNGENDGDSWICIVELNDGRWCCAEGSCDYTGWDCQAGNTITVAQSFQNLTRDGITPEWSRRLGIVKPNPEPEP